MNVLVTGGSASGKSAYAEKAACALAAQSIASASLVAPLVYVATMRAFGEEGMLRVRRHRRQRDGKGFTTLEQTHDLGELVRNSETAYLLTGATVLLEDVGNLVANELFDDAGSERNAAVAAEAAAAGVVSLESCCANIVAVTNEVGASGMSYDAATQRYVRCLGEVSNRLAARFDVVIECVCGFPCFLKGDLS